MARVLRRMRDGITLPPAEPARQGLPPAVAATSAETVGTLLLERLSATPDGHAYTQWLDGKGWCRITWREFGETVGRYQGGLRRSGLEPGDRVAIMAPNGVVWAALDLAAMALGMVTVPIYHEDRADSARYVLDHSGATALFISHRDQLAQIAAHGLPDCLQTVVVLSGDAGAERCRTLDEWQADHATGPEAATLAADELATIVYTSGTTGKPKGVMLSHRNLVSNARAAAREVELSTDDLLVSFLPLSHMLERTCGFLAPMTLGTPVAFARSIDTLTDDLQTLQPTFLVAVPRIFERVHLAVMRAFQQRPAWLRGLFQLCVDAGWARFQRRAGRAGRHPAELLLPLLAPLFARGIRGAFGGRLRAAVSGGAALAPPVARLFIGTGIELLQGYGLTEASPVISGNRIGDNDPGSVGKPLPGIEVRIAGNGEILARGPNVMLGYWQDDTATAATIDGDGWLHTGDLGQLRDGRLFITGRAKEIIVLSNGEKVAPADIEGAMAADPVIEQAMVVGEGKPFLAALVVLNATALEGALHELGMACTPDEALDRQQLKDWILARIGEAMHEFPGFAKVYQVGLLLEPWTLDNGLATATLKIRREAIATQFSALIDRMYAGH